MRENPLYPSVRTASKKVLPLAELRASMEGKRESEKAAELVATIWSNSLIPGERSSGYQFYVNALQSWLSSKTSNTKRSYAGTLVNFFDFASRRRSKGGDTIQLVAPHQLNQSDIDEYVAYLTRPSVSPETLTNTDERKVFEWLLDYFSTGRRDVSASSAKSLLQKEGVDTSFPNYKVRKGFRAKARRNYGNFDYIVSSLARKLLVNKLPINKDKPDAELSDDYFIEPRPLPTTHRPSTQIQRLQALSSFWAHLLTDKKLGMSRRPGALEPVNPWTEPSRLTAKAAPEDQIRKAARKMSVADLSKVANKLAFERLDIKDPGFLSLKNILATRDELAVFFYTSTGLRRQEGMMARVENLKDTPVGAGKLLLLGGIRRKGRRSEEEVFVPIYVLKLRQHLYSLMKQYTDESEQYARWIKANNDPDSGELKMALMRRGHFQKAFQSALAHADRGPLIPALGRWGNAIYKAQEKGQEDSVALFGVDLTQVPMDGRNLLDRMQRLARGKEERKAKYHPHALRHLSVTMAEGVGDGSRLAHAIAGHRSAATTDIYRDMVSLQAAAVLKVDAELQDIFAKADALARGTAPVHVQPGESVVEVQPQEEPRTEEPKVEIVEVTPAQSTLVEFYDHPSVKAIIGSAKKNLNEFVEKSQAAADIIRDQLPKETLQTTTGDKIENVQVQQGIAAIGQRLPGERAPRRAPNRQPLTAEQVINAIPPESFFLPASSWPPGGKWEAPTYVNRVNMDRIVASGMFVGPSAITQWGFPSAKSGNKGDVASFKDMDALGMFSSPRTYLAYRVAVNRATEIKSEFSDDHLGLFTPPGLMKRNADGEEEKRYKKERKIERKAERLVYFPICNVADPEWMMKLADRAVVEHEAVAMTDPGAAKSMVRWMAVLFQLGKSSMAILSENIPKGGGAGVSWIKEEDMVSRIDETTYQAFERTRGSTFRQHSINEVIEFLKTEGVRQYSGELGTEFKFGDKERLTSELLSRIEKNLDEMSAFQELDVSSFLHVYPLPPWVTATDDALGDEKYGLGEAEQVEAKKWFRSISGEFTVGKMVEFDISATAFRQFFPLMMEYIFGGPEFVTVGYPADPLLKKSVENFLSARGIDPVVGCRRFMRHLWEVRKANEYAFIGGRKASDRASDNISKIDQVWGLMWSWIIPTMGSFKKHIELKGRPVGFEDMKNLMERYMSKESLASRLPPLEKELPKFREQVENVLLSTSMSPDEKVKRMDKFAMDILKQKAEEMIRSGVRDSESFSHAIASSYVSKAASWQEAVKNPTVFRDMVNTSYFSGAISSRDIEKAFDAYVGAEFIYLMLLNFFALNSKAVYAELMGYSHSESKEVVESYLGRSTWEDGGTGDAEDGGHEKKFVTTKEEYLDRIQSNLEAMMKSGNSKEYATAWAWISLRSVNFDKLPPVTKSANVYEDSLDRIASDASTFIPIKSKESDEIMEILKSYHGPDAELLVNLYSVIYRKPTYAYNADRKALDKILRNVRYSTEEDILEALGIMDKIQGQLEKSEAGMNARFSKAMATPSTAEAIRRQAEKFLSSKPERPAAKGITVRKAKEEPKKVALDPISEEITRLYSQVSGTAAFDAKDRELGLSMSFRNLAELNPIKKRRLLNELIKLSELKPNLRGSFQPSKAKTSPILQSNLDLIRGIRLSMPRLVCALYADPPKPKAARRPS